MKFILVFTSLLFATMNSFAQTAANPYPKTITVTGSAEMEIVPDEIYVQVDLREYEKKNQPKVEIEKIKQDFLNAAHSVGIADSLISIASYDGNSNNPWLRKKRKDELMSSISYQIKLKTSKQMDDLVNVLDDNATQNFAIVRTSHSKIAEYRKQLKILAVKAAKEKGKYLSEAIEEKLGDAVTINEPQENIIVPYMSRTANVAYSKMNDTNIEQVPVDFKKMKLKYDVSVVFALM